MPSLLSRLARLSAKRPLLTVVTWLVALVAFAVLTLTSLQLSDAGFDVPGTDSSRAMETLESEFPDSETQPTLQLVVDASPGSILDAGPSTALREALDEMAALANVDTVSDPLDPASPFISADQTTAVAQITFGELDEEQAEQATESMREIASQVTDTGITAEVGGAVGGGVPEIFGPTEIIGAGIAFLVLLLTLGSLVAAGANMLGALVGVGTGVLGILAASVLVPVGSVTPILAVMLGLAVGIDYCLFIVWRFRAELRAGRSTIDAIGIAAGTAGSSVVFAGLTVIIALAGLLVVGIPFLGEMGVAAAFAVAVAVLMSLTLLPAFLVWAGRRALPRRERGATPAEPRPSRFSAAWARAVTRRPLLAILGSTVLLAVVAIPMLSMKTTLAVPGGEDPASSQRAAYDLVADRFGDGAQDPLVVLAEGEGTLSDDDQARALTALQEVDGVAAVIPVQTSADGDVTMLTVIAESGPLDDATVQLVRDIRALQIDGVDLAVTGSTAIGLDSDEQLSSALIVYVALIVGLALILMIVLFRSLLVPVVATVGFLLSLGAALGATVAVFQWGWLDAVIQAPQGNPLLSLLPLFVTGILFGLAMDYQVFLVSRMQEAYHAGFTPRDAIRAGFEHSAPVVVAAAAIMAAVFGGFALSPSSLVGAIALALTVGVLADAFIVRMILVPAALAVLGRSAWWIPSWLERMLPRVDIEGHSLERGESRTHDAAH